MNIKPILFSILVLGSLVFSTIVEAQTRVPGNTNSNRSSSNNNIENNSIFSEKTTKNGLKYRPILIPFIGGGLNSINGFTNYQININPMGGVAIGNNFRVALGPIFEYAQFGTTQSNTKYRALGGNAFAQYNVFNLDNLLGKGNNTRLFLHAEYAVRRAKDLNTDFTQTVNSLPLGAGITQPISGMSSFQAMVLYNPLDASIYENSGLTYRFGFGIGF